MKKRKFIFLTNAYMPNPGATGVCVHQVAKDLVSRGENVVVICFDDGNNHENVVDNIRTVRIKAPFFIQPYKGKNKYMSRCHWAVSLFFKLLYINNYPLRSKQLVNRYLKAIMREEDNQTDLFIIATYTPLEGVVAAAKYKEKNRGAKVIYYSTDTLSNESGESGILSAKSRTKLGLKWELYLFSVYDRILIMDCHKNHYEKDIYSQFSAKIKYASFPLIVKPTCYKDTMATHTIKTVVFAGNLYSKMRNPRYICKLMMSTFTASQMKVIFIGGGDCLEEMRSLSQESKGMIQYVGFQPYTFVENALVDADVLLSIGNSFSSMCPSKIYEYMSTGKPIIHSYTYEKDPCLEPLEKYGNSLLLKEGVEDNQSKLMTYISDLRVINFSEIAHNFELNTPQFTANLISSVE